mmetsp:Transcript_1370/g.2742  ORF Transcript_1370/g.2742 Transcript_1370/m.2742 type:complete len:174 (-) Transcript_1370:210-731(-)
MPVRDTSMMRSKSSSITIGDTPAVGSSSISTLGLVISARPTATCCRWPPESSPAACARFSRRIGKRSKTCSIVSRKSSLRMKAPISRFSCTVIEVKMFEVCGTKPMPAPTRSCGLRREMSCPSSNTRPWRRFSIPKTAFIAVDFPAPLGPTMTAISPGFTAMVQSWRMSGPAP